CRRSARISGGQSRASTAYGTTIDVGVRDLKDAPSDWNICTVRTGSGLEGAGMTVPVGTRMTGLGIVSISAIVSRAPSSPFADTLTSACKGTSIDGSAGNDEPSATSRRVIEIEAGADMVSIG